MMQTVRVRTIKGYRDYEVLNCARRGDTLHYTLRTSNGKVIKYGTKIKEDSKERHLHNRQALY